MISPFIILGCGGHGRVVLDMLRILGHEVIGFTDLNPALRGVSVDGVPVIGGDKEILKMRGGDISLAMGLGGTGDNLPRRKLFEKFSQKGYEFPVLVHPSSIASAKVVFADGTIIMAGAVVQTGCKIGQNVIINTGAVADHDCVLGDHSHIAPGAVLSGNVSVGSSAHVGTGAVVIQNIRIGEGAIVAAGAVVIRDVPPHTVVMGVPARERNRVEFTRAEKSL